MRRFGIRQQVARLTLTPLLLMAISLEIFFLYNRFSDLDRSLLERGNLIVHQLASSSEYGVFSNNLSLLRDVANGALGQEDVRRAIILDPDSNVLVSAGAFSAHLKGELFARMLATNEQIRLLPLASAEEMDDAIILQPPAGSEGHSIWLYHAIIPVQVALDESGTRARVKPVGAVIVEISKLRYELLKERMLWTTLLATSLFLALAFYLVSRASRSITAPIRRLSNAVQDIGAGKLDTRVYLHSTAQELDTLAQGLNETAESLQKQRAELQLRIDEATSALREEKEAAERATRNKSHFLATASHDLRQPLHALGLYMSELQHRVSGTEQQNLVGKVEQSVEALSSLLNALLDISKLDAGTIVPQLQTCAAGALLERIVSDFQMLAGIKNIRLKVRICPGYITSDPQLLERILINLMGNAIRYTGENGCVLVACRRRGDFLRIEVRDNGVGISKSDQGNIFREFYQVSPSRTDASRGLGLGLAIVNRLVKLLGYRLELRSASGKGSVFAVEVPLARQSDQLSSVAQALSDPGPGPVESPLVGKRILIVEDDHMVLAGTASLIASWGCIVSTAASLAEVEQLLREDQSWDFIISDYQLGEDETGIDAVARVRQHHARQIPCILISGDTSPTITELASASGHHLMHKPVRPAKLRSMIVYLLEMNA